MHLPVPTPHFSAPHVPALRLSVPRLTGHQLPLATLLLSAVYAIAVVVALASPSADTSAGLAVLAGLAARWAAHRRSTVSAVSAGTVDVDAVLPEGAVVTQVAPAPAAAA
ncbi:MAG: hypothetical protein JWR62_2674 [Modestobacter sp.]|nr:hypothetical protein [Modestobacter sp.]